MEVTGDIVLKVSIPTACQGAKMSRFSLMIVVLFLMTDAAALLPGEEPTTLPVPDLTKPHPFCVHDMVRMARVGAAIPSPDGLSAVFTVRVWDADQNKVSTNLWVIRLEDGQTRQLTTLKSHSDLGPAWAPDGRTIVFVSNRSGSRQAWTIAIDGGEPRQLTQYPIDVDNLRWSPDGSHLAFSAEVYPGSDMIATAQRDKLRADNPVKAMKFDRLMVRHWDSWNEGKRNHIFVVPVKLTQGSWSTDGVPRDLMAAVDGDCPVKPFGGPDDYAWSPDGSEITYTTQLGHDEAWSTDLNLFSVAVSGGEAKALTPDNAATDTNPVYSPDGKWIAYRSMARAGFEADRFRIKILERATGKTRTLTEKWDRSPESLVWAGDGKSLFVTADEAARHKVFRVTVDTGEPKVVINDHYNSGLAIVTGQTPNRAANPGRQDVKLIYGQDSLTTPNEIWIADLDGRNARQLTRFTTERMALAQVTQPEEFRFAGADGDSVQAWILKPVAWQKGKKYPLALVIHGGPQGAIEDHFHYRWNMQALAGAGYAVVAINFHGSTGFGQAFTDSISGDWGGRPFEDLMKGVDYALANYDWLDSERVGALGASYGGWMINWINGHTNRFRCLVNHDGGFDEFANYFTTEELWFPEWEFKGTPWANPELYDKFSPSRFVGKWQTPTLVIHGANDFRLVDAEGIATFTALQRRGIPSRFLYFPDENHWVLKAKNSIVWHDTIISWLDQWLKQP